MKKENNSSTIRVKRKDWEQMDHTLAVVTHELEKAQGGAYVAESAEELFQALEK